MVSKRFARICSKYGLKKNEDTHLLYLLTEGIDFDWAIRKCYEQDDDGGRVNYYEIARLLQVLSGKKIQVSSVEDSVSVITIQEELRAFCNKMLVEGRGWYYEHIGIAEAGKHFYPRGILEDIKMYQLYSRKDLAAIIEEEVNIKKAETTLKGRTTASLPIKGMYASALLDNCPQVFCALKPTDKYNLLADLLECAGVVGFEVEDRHERYQLVRQWEASFRKANKKIKEMGQGNQTKVGGFPVVLPGGWFSSIEHINKYDMWEDMDF